MDKRKAYFTECINPVVSIITPFYNTNNVFKETSTSIYSQTLTNWEWIIVNDGSNVAESIAALDELRSKADTRIKIVNHSHNKGLPAARNTGIKNAAAEYIFFIDSDDLIDPTTLEKMICFLCVNPEFHFVNSYVKGFGSQNYKWNGGFHERLLFLQENRNTSCFMARRNIFNDLEFDETMKWGCEDWEFWIHCASLKKWGYTIPEYLFHYRRVDGNRWDTLSGKAVLKNTGLIIRNKYLQEIQKYGFPAPEFESYQFGKTGQPIPVYKANADEQKVLVCIFPWLKIGGVDKFNLDLLKGLKQKGWSITIITTLGNEHPWQKYFEEVTNEIFHLNNLAPAHKYHAFVEYIINTRKPGTLFLSNSMYAYQILTYIRKQYPHLYIVDYAHCEEPDWYSGGYPFLASVNSGLLNKIFITSEYLRQWMHDRGAILSKTKVCYIGVDVNKIKRDTITRTELRNQLKLRNDTIVIIFVARLTEQKQPIVWAKSIYLLSQNNNNFHCIVIGDGPDEAKLKAAIKKYKLINKITFLGAQPNDMVLKYMDAADIFFLPSAYEGIALSIYESMAKNLVIIGANVGGQAELVSSDCGYLIERSTPEKEAAEYSYYLKHLCSEPDKIKLMGDAGRRRVVQYFGLQRAIDMFESEIQKEPFKTADETCLFENARADIVMANHISHLEKWGELNVRSTGLLRKYLSSKKIYKAFRPAAKKLYGLIKKYFNI